MIWQLFKLLPRFSILETTNHKPFTVTANHKLQATNQTDCQQLQFLITQNHGTGHTCLANHPIVHINLS
jgi:hypothetical protein